MRDLLYLTLLLEVLARVANPDPLLERKAKAHNALCLPLIAYEGPAWRELNAAKLKLDAEYTQRTSTGVTEEAVNWYEAQAQRLTDQIASLEAQKEAQ